MNTQTSESPEKATEDLDGDFHKELRKLIKKYHREKPSNTPDFILATYLLDCLDAFDEAVRKRAEWYGHNPMDPKDEITKQELSEAPVG